MRIIVRLDLKEKFVIKPIQFEGLRKIGNPKDLAKKYYNNGADELILINVVSSLYDTKWIEKYVRTISREIFIPITVGGGIKNVTEALKFFKYGVDKIAICSALFDNKNLLKDLSKEFGSQSVVASIQANKIGNDWYAFKEMARVNTKKKVYDWIKECIDNGAGEILLTSVKHDGRMKGLDIEMFNEYCDICSVPLIIAGGFNSTQNLKKLKKFPDAISASSIFHFDKTTPKAIKDNFNYE
jgi:cyclase|tara:strand:- start:90 stop:812 length:723 start_codon:yes stop_codon:yes gene_type:complete